MSSRKEICPECDADLRGAPIPADYITKGYYSPGITHYSRTIGHEIRGIYDGVLFWSCPDCSHAWPRDFGDWDRLNELSAKYAAEFSAERFIA
jgi:Zn-finger nucleic acid-binding protein